MPAQFNKNASFCHAYLTCRNTAVSNRRRGRQEKEGEIIPLIGNTLNISLCLHWMGQEESRTNIAVLPPQKGCGTGWRALDSTPSARLEVDTAFSISSLQRRNWRLQSSKWEWCQFSSSLATEFLPPSSSLKCPRIWASWLGNNEELQGRSLTLFLFLSIPTATELQTVESSKASSPFLDSPSSLSPTPKYKPDYHISSSLYRKEHYSSWHPLPFI